MVCPLLSLPKPGGSHRGSQAPTPANPEGETAAATPPKWRWLCGVCQEAGHDKRDCPNKPSSQVRNFFISFVCICWCIFVYYMLVIINSQHYWVDLPCPSRWTDWHQFPGYMISQLRSASPRKDWFTLTNMYVMVSCTGETCKSTLPRTKASAYFTMSTVFFSFWCPPKNWGLSNSCTKPKWTKPSSNSLTLWN